jgi:adenylate cyclase
MTIEIERKFVLHTVPSKDFLGDGVALRQGYVAEEGEVSVRIRITPTQALLTVKAGVGLTRTEVEVEISSEQANALWPHTSTRRIAKTRHRVRLDGQQQLVAEVDVYADELDGLYTVEVEFPSEEQAAEFVPPQWFGVEVTGNRAWTNAALARNGRPESG